jgi:hypothetical protein
LAVMSGSRIMSGIRPVGAIGSGGEAAKAAKEEALAGDFFAASPAELGDEAVAADLGDEAVAADFFPRGDAVADGGLEVHAEEELDMGMRRTAKMNDPKEPKKQEREEHEKTHLPFRSWCRHCIRGRGKEAAHRKQEGGGGLPEVHFDFAFMGDEAYAGNTVPMLVVRAKEDRMTLPTAVPRKSAGEFVVSRVIAFLRRSASRSWTSSRSRTRSRPS